MNTVNNIRLSFRVSYEEKKEIDHNAFLAGVNRSSYLRKVALNAEIHSALDKQLVNTLLKLNADMGRVGGLFKLWLSKYEDRSTLNERMEVRDFVKEIKLTKEKIIKVIDELNIKNDSQRDN